MIYDGDTLLFSARELQCPETLEISLAPKFVDHLRELRIFFNHPMKVNSACRSYSYNVSIDGHPRSLHIHDRPFHPTKGCCAVDIHMLGGGLRGNLVSCAWKLGWSIGISKTFIHLDRRSDYLPRPQTMFVY